MTERPPSPPRSLDELRARATRLAGCSVGELGARLGYRVPADLRGNKGFVGQLVELALGASAGSDPEPDFPDLGVELKTLPVYPSGRTAESTYVCMARLDGSETLAYATSHVAKKLARVLFVPLALDPRPSELGPDEARLASPTALRDRRFGMPFLWEPDAFDRELLEADFAMLQARIMLGEAEDVRGAEGAVLQLRPKALTRADRTWGVSAEGWTVPVRPRGWYLRASFTSTLVARAFGLVLR